MSATLESRKLAGYFAGAGLRVREVEVRGRFHPIEIYNLKSATEDYVTETVEMILRVHFEFPPGDILAFLTGQEEIEAVVDTLASRSRAHAPAFEGKPLVALPLFSALPPESQRKIFASANGRKAIISTNVAETALTIPGVRYVIDCGFVKLRVFDSARRLDSLVVVPESRASAAQRAGRAGREAPGKCFRLFPAAALGGLEEFPTPEVFRADPLGLTLSVRGLGRDPRTVEFPDSPDCDFNRAHDLLRRMGALDLHNALTPIGKHMLEIPQDCFAAFCLLNVCGEPPELREHLATLLALQSAEPIFAPQKNRATEIKQKILAICPERSDHLAKLKIFYKFVQAKNRKDFCAAYGLRAKSLELATLVRAQLLEVLARITEALRTGKLPPRKPNSKTLEFRNEISKIVPTPIDSQKLLKILAKSFFENVAEFEGSGVYRIVSSGVTVKIHPQSLLFDLKVKPRRVVFSSVATTTATYMIDVSEIPIYDI